jgi:hypothetical protein
MLDKSVKNRFLQQNPRQETRVPAFRNGTLPAISGVQERTQVRYDTDAQAALNEARHADVWKALSPSDVLATVDDLVAQLLEARHHPVDALVAHGPRYRCVKAPRGAPADARGGGASSGPLLEAAITR